MQKASFDKMAESLPIKKKPQYEVANEVLEKIHSEKIEIKIEDMIKAKNCAETLTSSLVQAFKDNDKFFEFLYKDIIPVGSVPEDLKIGRANEFDFMIVLDLEKLPGFKVAELIQADFVVLKMKKPNDSEMIPKWLSPDFSDPFEKYEIAQIKYLYDLSEDEMLIDPRKCRAWFLQHAFYEILPTFRKNMKLKGLDVHETFHSYSRMGMSLDITVLSKECGIFNVDFVLAFSCQIRSLKSKCVPRTFFAINQIMENPEWLRAQSVTFQKILKNVLLNHDVLFVPVTPLQFATGIRTIWNWRLEFAKVESLIINYQGREPLKKMIRLMKYFRNKAFWRKLVKSQHLKSVVLDMFKIHPELSWWSDENLSKNFVECLDHLQQSLKNGFLPNFFFHERNVFGKNIEDRSDILSLKGRGLLVNIDVETLKASFEIENEKCEEIWLKSFGEVEKPNDAASYNAKSEFARLYITCVNTHLTIESRKMISRENFHENVDDKE